MHSLLSLLGIDPSSRSQRRANALAKADLEYIRDLVQLRKSQGLSQQDLADKMGISQATVASFERYDNDPKLSTIRRYSHAVEALVKHVVVHDDGQLVNGDQWITVNFAPIVQTNLSAPRRAELAVKARGKYSLAA